MQGRNPAGGQGQQPGQAPSSSQGRLNQLLNGNNKVAQTLSQVEAKTGLKREHLLYILLSIPAIIVTMFIGGDLVLLGLALVYPGVKTTQALESNDAQEMQRWLAYWIVFGLSYCIDVVIEMFLFWLPMLFWLKIIYIGWLVAPHPYCGSITAYEGLIGPKIREILPQFQAQVDRLVSTGKSLAGKAGAPIGETGLSGGTPSRSNSQIYGSQQPGPAPGSSGLPRSRGPSQSGAYGSQGGAYGSQAGGAASQGGAGSASQGGVGGASQGGAGGASQGGGGGASRGGSQAYGSQGAGAYGSQAGGSQAAGSQAYGSQAAGSQAAGSQAAGSQAAGSQYAGSRAYGSQAAGSQAAGSQAAGSQAAGSQAAGSQAAGSQAYGSQAAGSQAAGSQAYGSQAAGSQAAGSQAYGSQAYGSQTGGSQAYGSQANEEHQSGGSQSSEHKE